MKKLSLLFLTVLLVFYACSKKNTVKVIETNFDEEISVTANLTLTFDKDIVPDSIVNTWSDDIFLLIKPEIEGKFMWTATNKLVFTPAKGFEPSTDYTCTVAKEVLKYTEGLQLSGNTEFTFHTPYLDIADIKAYWTTGEGAGAGAQLRFDIQFNQEIKTEDVADKLNVEINKDKKSYNVIASDAPDVVSLIVTDITAEDKEYSAEITIKKGISPATGAVKTTKDFVEEFDIPSPFKLTIDDVQANHDGTDGTITVYTSQPVSEKDIKNYISLNPYVKFTIDIQKNYFVLKSSQFNVSSKYELTVKQGLAGKIGGTLKYDYTQSLTFGQLQPQIKFVNKKEFYLSGKGSRNIEVAIINVPKVYITITKVYDNNILRFIKNYSISSSNDYYDDYYDDYYYYDDYSSSSSDLGDVIYEKEINTNELPRNGNYRLLAMDFEDKLAEYKGIYLIDVKSPDDYYLRAKKVVSVSDIGLIAKEGPGSITVFANSLKTAEPLADIEIKIIGENNQVTFTGKTNADGIVTYSFSELPAIGFKAKMISARQGSDYNFLPFQYTEVATSRFDVGGKWQNPSGIEAFIYGERNLYRPGETVNLTAILRNDKWQTPGQIPVILNFVTPNGKVFKSIKKMLNAHGSFETSIEVPASATTGTYTAEVMSSNNVFLGSRNISIEEFVPDRIKVDVSMEKNEYKPGDNINVALKAVNFFGPPAAGRNYEVEMSTMRKSFYPKEYRDYNYFIEGATSYFSRDYRDGETDEQGMAAEDFTVNNHFKNMGILQSDFYITVFDESGRPVNRKKTVDIYTQDVFYGVKYDGYYAKTGEPVKIDIIALDKDGKPQDNVEAKIKLIKHEYKTVLTNSGNYFRYRSEKVEKFLENKVIKINGENSNFSFIPEQSGTYEFRIASPDAYTYVSRTIYAYGWGSTTSSSFEVNNEGQIDIQLDKEKYQVGDKANVILKAPFSGKILVTVERNSVMEHFYITTEKRAAKFELDLKEEYVPNVYISATLFRPHEESDIPLTVAHGFAPVMVEQPANILPVKITAEEKSRSNTKQTITVKSKPNTAITIAVVDEGILQVGGYSTPDPYDFFYQKQALAVNSFDVYPYLFPEIATGKSASGGGDYEEDEKNGGDKRQNPLSNKRFKLVSFWSGIRETNASGEAQFEVNIPQFSGDLRIMAVTYKDNTFGSGSANMKVADPLVMSVGLPRFLSPKDTVIVPVMLSNTTDKSTKCKTTIKVEGPLVIVGKDELSTSVNGNTEGEVVFKLVAKPAIGEAKVIVKTEALGDTYENTTDITVRPPSSLQKNTGSGMVKAGESMKFSMNASRFIASSIDNKLVVSTNPLIQFSKNLEYLVGYPHGCVEQTVSKAFPQIYYSDMAKIVQSSKQNNVAENHVQAAIDKLKLMQLYDGSLTYWPGGGYASWWGSVYAAHFLVEAQKAGYSVDKDFLDKLLKYLETRLKQKETFTYYYNGTQQRVIAHQEIPYTLYVLALAGEKETSMMNYYKANLDQLSLDGKYLLAASYALSGDKKKYKEILPAGFTGEKSNRSLGGSFYSYIRDEAIALNVLLEVEPENQQIGIMAKHIADYMKNERYLNTQESVFGFLAMGKMARKSAGSKVSATITSNGKEVAKYSDNVLTLNTKQLNGTEINITTSGTGQLYYFWEAEGISEDGTYQEEDNYLKVRRTFYDRNGNIISGNTFEQNDLVLVEIAVQGLVSKTIDNVVITDIIPAGFEIENPRITILPPGMSWPHSRSYSEYQDYRDDRIHFYCNIYGNYNSYYYYLVRAVTKGSFHMGPVSADAMYNGEYHSYHGGGKVIINEKEK